MLINKEMHEARVKNIRAAVKDTEHDYYIFRTEKSWDDGGMQWCRSYITSDLDDVKLYINIIKDEVEHFDLLIDFDEFENGEGKKVRGFTQVYLAQGHEKGADKLYYYAGYIRKIEKEQHKTK